MAWRVFILCAVSSLQAFALNFDTDVPANIKSQMLDDLHFVSQIEGTQQSPFHQQIFGAVSGLRYTQFFESHITSVGMDSCGGGAAVACVMPFLGKKMWLTDNFVNFSHPQIARLMVVFHEARHTESSQGNWAHQRCPRPFLDENGRDKVSIWTGAKLEGESACDRTAFGSYGSSTIMLKNISLHCSNCNEKVRMDADIYVADQLGRITSANVKQSMLDDFATH